ncbi:hypothetical protein ES705_29769 [subsurface metagenome]
MDTSTISIVPGPFSEAVPWIVGGEFIGIPSCGAEIVESGASVSKVKLTSLPLSVCPAVSVACAFIL